MSGCSRTVLRYIPSEPQTPLNSRPPPPPSPSPPSPPPNNKPPPTPSTHASPHPLPPSSSWRSSAAWRRTQLIASTPCLKGAAARMRSDNNYRPLTTKHKYQTCIKYATHSPAASSTAAPSSTCCTLPLTLQPNFSNNVRRCNLVPLPNSGYRVTRACPTSGCRSHFILQ